MYSFMPYMYDKEWNYCIKRTDDQIYIDTTNLTVDEEVAIIEKIVMGDRNEKNDR